MQLTRLPIEDAPEHTPVLIGNSTHWERAYLENGKWVVFEAPINGRVQKFEWPHDPIRTETNPTWFAFFDPLF